jgi:hypothetical protein
MNTPEIGVLGVSLTNNNSLFKGLNKELKVYNGILMKYMICHLAQIY